MMWDEVIEKVERSFGGVCLLCKNSPAVNKEHFFASALGGTIYLKLLCARCNNNVGGKLVNTMKRDPRIVIPVYYQVRSKLPEVAHKFLRGLPLIGHSDGRKKTLVYGSTGIKFPKNVTEGDFTLIEPNFTASKAPDAAFLLVAYEMAALAIGAPILDDALDPVRHEILSMTKSTGRVLFAHQPTGKLVHSAAIRCLNAVLTIDLLLFGSARFSVELVGGKALAGWNGFVYSQDLQTGQPNVQKIKSRNLSG